MSVSRHGVHELSVLRYTSDLVVFLSKHWNLLQILVIYLIEKRSSSKQQTHEWYTYCKLVVGIRTRTVHPRDFDQVQEE